MPEEQTFPSVPRGHSSQSIRVGIEIGIALLVGLITYNARQITGELEGVLERLRLVEIAIEGHKHQVDALSKRIDGLVRSNELQWGDIRDLRGERMRR